MNKKTLTMKRLSLTVLAALSLVAGVAQAQTQSQSTTITKNAQGQIASVTDALGNTVTYQYDALGNLIQTNAAGSITTLQYDVRGNKIAMQDPAMGSWTYGYNAFRELVSQRDSLNQTTTLAYDVLGRMTKRTEPDLVSDWSYDTKFDGNACGKGIGKLCEAKTDNNYKRTHTYDSQGRPSSTATVLDNVASPEVVSETFDANTGRVATKTWPTGYQVSYSYTSLGYLSAVTGGGTNGFSQTTSYQILGMTPHGQVTQYRSGNNVTVVKTYDPLVERQIGQIGTTDGQTAGNVMNQAYRFNALGNLLARLDNTPGVGTQESFSYDSLNRLTTASILGGAVSPPTTTEVMYDQRGNIAYKSDVGRYWYDTARPNRMTQVTLETAAGATVALTGTRALSYAFDDNKVNAQSINGTTVGNGNLEYTVSQDTVNGKHTVRYESYTSFNMPSQIVYGNFVTNTSNTADRTLGFVYGPEHQRIKQSVALSGNGTSSYFAGNTWYLNGEDSLGLTYEKEVRANGTTEHKHYLSAQGFTFALFTSRTGTLNGLPATSTSYFHKDQMGSIAVITNETGAVTEHFAYDPWGKRRFISSTPGLPDTLDAITGVTTDRGYTEHEHLDEVGVIHMNGRIYDPLMARFMSADPILQSPYDLRSFNRYSYVWNNPMRMFDPTGFEAGESSSSGGWFSSVVSWFGGLFSGGSDGGGGSGGGSSGSGSSSGDAGNAFVCSCLFAVSSWQSMATGIPDAVLGIGAPGQWHVNPNASPEAAAAAKDAFNSPYASPNQQLQSGLQSVLNRNQTLSFYTVSGPQYGPHGAVEWAIQWQLENSSPNGGFIVQEMTIVGAGLDASGNRTMDVVSRYWEAWQVNPGSTTTTSRSRGFRYDDNFSFTGSDRSVSGSVSWTASARFYEGLTLPSTFVPHSVQHAGVLPATRENPNLPLENATPPVDRKFETIWP